MTIAATVKSYIEGRGITYETVTHPAAGSSQENARAAHVDEDHIAKAIILHDNTGAIMAVIPGGSWLRLNALNTELARDLKLADETEASGYFPDCEIGAIPPLGPAYGMQTLLDEALTSLAFVYFESGDHRTLIRVAGSDFLDLLGGVRRGHYCEGD